ncbi:LysR family transcriptional regulator [Pseudodesulfovibrio piezophilus]|uniref:Transcriptional regulator, LysR family n=1 Tax=Pseudodesulfovibrio piezophilus (strain DSM 21447 / JCM 15486 / C1TLV30) TaxID=1322246 RepID=M1WMD7_PSEP2|nr:LysR family transcriptional regulator [Pseudodesulfovibrio piezophilus]CCH49425.1 Transcriptional regulator, LysR family [Pseudodesulfovibrio piezophilus C1TLV30]
MELYQLKSFRAVAEAGNLTKASARIHASQPAVSAHIKALEEELGLPLFVRTPHGMQLTEMGQGLKIKADSILQAADDMLNQAKIYRQELTGDLVIALNTDTDFLRIAQLVTTLSVAHPKLRLKLFQSMSADILRDVRDRRIDAGFSFYDNPYPEVVAVALKKIPARIIAPLAWAEQVDGKSIEELAAMPWVKPNDECPFMKVIDELFAGTGVSLSDSIEADSESVIRELVAAGKGLSIIKESDAEAMCRSGQAVICETGPELSLTLFFLTPKSRATDPLIRAMTESVVSVWAGEEG